MEAAPSPSKPQPPECTFTERKGQRSSSCFLKHHQRNEEDTPAGARCDSSPGRGAVASRSVPAPVSQGKLEMGWLPNS